MCKEAIVAVLQTSMVEPGIDVPLRVKVGRVLGRVGDSRVGVTTLPPLLTPPLEGKFLYGEKQEEREVAPFQAGIYPLTNAQYEYFITAGGYDNKAWWSKIGWQVRQERDWTQPRYWDYSTYNVANQPVVGVSWYESEAFCRWLSEIEGQSYRLPTEAEWERLSRGEDGRAYPWGNEWQSGLSNTYAAKIKQPTPVGLFPGGISPTGGHDCAGNVWDWCLDWYDRDEDARVLRGGSYVSFVNQARCSFRYYDSPNTWDYNIGFRVVLVPPSQP